MHVSSSATTEVPSRPPAGAPEAMLTATVEYRLRGAVAVITVVNPPVNALSHSVRIGLMAGLARANADPAINAVVLMGGGKTYMAGADLKEFGRPKDPPELHEVQAAMEELVKPLVSAIHGTALGGGLEVALTGHWRVAARGAKLGLPEIKLGLMPGAGGNQRLTRLIGPRAALDLILSGNPVSAEQALQLGIVDEIVDGELLAGAVDFAHRVIVERRPLRIVSQLKDKTGDIDPALFAGVRQRIAREMPGLLAPQKIIDCVEAACTLPVGEAFHFDAESYKQCLDSPQRKAMIHLFFAERSCRRVPDLPEGLMAAKIRRAAVIGAGEVGVGIARRLAAAGIAVIPVEGYSNHDAAAGSDIVIETMFEDLQQKRDLLSRLEQVVSNDCVLATDTSFLDIDDIAAALANPARLIGAHFYDAPESASLVELVRGSHTSAQSVASLFELGRTLGLTTVLSGPSRGAIGRRMLRFLAAGAEYLLARGCSAGKIDGALARFGFAVNPLALADSLRERSGSDVASPETSALRSWDDAEIIARLLHPVVNEGARILEQGIALRASDMDLIWVRGLGFPQYLGGPMYWGSRIGLETVAATAETVAAELGADWQPAELLLRLIAGGKNFISE